MKKLITIIIAIMAICVQSASAQYAKIMLQHEGKATLFEQTGLQSAIDASVDGDTIYIPEGSYNSQNVTITKKISIIGQGEKSQIGNVTINLPGGTEMTSTILYGVTADWVGIICSVSNLHIDKCTMNKLEIKPKSSTTTKTYVLKDLLVERCFVRGNGRYTGYGLYARANADGYDDIENCIFKNCKIEDFDNKALDAYFVNCWIYKRYGTSTYMYGNYVNSTIGVYSYYFDSQTSFLNCLLSSDPGVKSVSNIYIDSKLDYTDEELEVKGYLGTDGTIVGPGGGDRPYNLVPSVPSLEDIQLDVNYTTKKLNVTVKVKAN